MRTSSTPNAVGSGRGGGGGNTGGLSGVLADEKRLRNLARAMSTKASGTICGGGQREMS